MSLVDDRFCDTPVARRFDCIWSSEGDSRTQPKAPNLSSGM